MTISSITPECINEVMNTKADENPEVGMGATRFVGSDRYSMVVTEVLSPKKVKVAHVPNEMMEKFITDENGVMRLPKKCLDEIIKMGEREYEFSGPYYAGIEYTLRKNGRWLPKGLGLWETCSVRFGYAEDYRDPCF